MILTKYYEERGQIVAEARDLLNQAEKETDTTKATELEQRHDAAIAKLDELDKKIAREERTARSREARRRAPVEPASDGPRRQCQRG